MLITEIPTHFAVTNQLLLKHFALHPGRDVEVRREGSMHVGRTIFVRDVKDQDKYNEWIYFHALISKSDELVDFYYNPHRYTLKGDLSEPQIKSIARDEYLEEKDLLGYIFECHTPIQKTYEELYALFEAQDPIVLDALRNYYFANSLSNNASKHINVSYWQIVIYMGVIETFMGEQPQCRNSNQCRICKTTLGAHNLISNSKWLEENMFKKIRNADIRNQYRRIITECKYSIRNGSVHGSLLPVAQHPHLEDGNYYYDIEKTLSKYWKDANALESLVKHMEELTRFYALNQIFNTEIYPELRGTHVGYITLRTK